MREPQCGEKTSAICDGSSDYANGLGRIRAHAFQSKRHDDSRHRGNHMRAEEREKDDGGKGHPVLMNAKQSSRRAGGPRQADRTSRQDPDNDFPIEDAQNGAAHSPRPPFRAR